MRKSKIGTCIIGLCFLVFLYGCASTPPAPARDNREAEAEAAAAAAVAAMNGSPPPSSASSGPVAVNSSRTEPAWVSSPDSVFNRNTFVTGVGAGNNRAQAEMNALAALSSVFHRSLQADETITNSYQEMIKNGSAASWIENTSVESAIKASTSMDLIGAEIRDVWFDSKSTYYAAAVMEVDKTARLYTQMIQDNQQIINTLLDIPAADRNSIDSLARYQFAVTIAEVNQIFTNVLSVINSPVPADVKRPAEYRSEVANILRAIPVSVIVENDRENRVRDAFSSVLSAAGFRTGGNNTRYQLQARLSLSEVSLANQNNKFVRYVVDGNFVDTSSDAILFPYNINGREGHLSLSEAEVRAVRAAETKIKEDYAAALNAYLSQLIPKK
ncbi:putative lipoprotein [Treponema primitia ZAS-2]|uniref:Putative lipoprotein n=1 Tax=Treponema primitia (strain ATCC BAA-887 / DSM 12427 / ZAS-2) TaxID=545694 RepID=F5YK41_TREPZ|nr:LPP20 family lipoprotein [Treponema primitia]AEF86254.1 putative lipoprotein [Treponema primitia ZAS-2]